VHLLKNCDQSNNTWSSYFSKLFNHHFIINCAVCCQSVFIAQYQPSPNRQSIFTAQSQTLPHSYSIHLVGTCSGTVTVSDTLANRCIWTRLIDRNEHHWISRRDFQYCTITEIENNYLLYIYIFTFFITYFI
jgi:hypothetical protein